MKNKKWYVVSMIACTLLLLPFGQKQVAAETKEEPVEEKFQNRKQVDLELFQVYYPETWKYDEENIYNEEDYANVLFFDGETRDDSTYEVLISGESETAYSYRKSLDAYGVELRDFAEGNMEKSVIGNAEFTIIPQNDSGSYFYLYRHEPSGISYTVRINSGQEDDKVRELLEGMVLKLKDEGKMDSPWPWEGEVFQPVLKEQMVGTYLINPEYIPFEVPQGIMKIMDHKFYKQGNQVFHLIEDKLDTYEYTENGLKFVSTMDLEDEYEYISSDEGGMLYLSQGIFEVIGVKEGKQALQTTVTGDLAMHPSGE